MPKISNPANHMRPAEGGAFILPSVGWVPEQPLLYTQTSAIALQSTTDPMGAHCERPLLERATNRPSDCGASPVQSCAGRLADGGGGDVFSAG